MVTVKSYDSVLEAIKRSEHKHHYKKYARRLNGTTQKLSTQHASTPLLLKSMNVPGRITWSEGVVPS